MQSNYSQPYSALPEFLTHRITNKENSCYCHLASGLFTIWYVLVSFLLLSHNTWDDLLKKRKGPFGLTVPEIQVHGQLALWKRGHIIARGREHIEEQSIHLMGIQEARRERLAGAPISHQWPTSLCLEDFQLGPTSSKVTICQWHHGLRTKLLTQDMGDPYLNSIAATDKWNTKARKRWCSLLSWSLQSLFLYKWKV
jgi:hypothetical protein